MVLPENIASDTQDFEWKEFPLEADYHSVWKNYDSILDYLNEVNETL